MTTDEIWLRSIGARGDQADDQPGPATAPTEPTQAPVPPIEVAQPAAATDAHAADPPLAVEVGAVDLDVAATSTADDADDDEPGSRRFTPWVAAAFGIAAAVATITTVTVALWGSGDPTPAAATASTTGHRPPPPPPPAPAAQPVTADAPIPFTASSDCLLGSTAAQSMADPQSHTPWICISGGEGQVLQIDLGRAYVITAVSIVPGAITKGPADQGDPWLQHRVVTRLQWEFDDTEHTIRPQNTQNVHGKAPLPIPNVLASHITVIIQQTSRPPQVSPTTATPASKPRDTMLDPILGAGPAAPSTDPDTPDPGLQSDATGPDPSDNSFAVSSIEIIGHRAI